ncbi:MAG: endonuclease/exonuclease/phosphatase family protein, partial [Patescibacteria group bacterium]
MRLMTYNVYAGGRERFSIVEEIVKLVRPDILAIQEACNWDKTGQFTAIRELLRVADSRAVFFKSNQRSNSGRTYDLAFYSRYPILEYKVFSDPDIIWHSLGLVTVKVNTKEVAVLVCHLSPQSEDWRLKEVNKIK